MERARYQFGSLTRKKRAKGSDAWEFRYYESTAQGTRERRTATVGTVDKYKTKALAQKAVEALLLNSTLKLHNSAWPWSPSEPFVTDILRKNCQNDTRRRSPIDRISRTTSSHAGATICSTRFDLWRSKIG